MFVEERHRLISSEGWNVEGETKTFSEKINNFYWPSHYPWLNQIANPVNGFRKTQLVWRILVFLTLFSLLLSEIIYLWSLRPFIFLTLWGYTLSTIVFGMMIPYSFINKDQESGFQKYMYRTCLVMYSTAFTIEFLITLVFWTLLYEGVPVFQNIDTFNLHSYHFLPLLFLLIDYITNRWMLVYSHVIFIELFAVVYAVFNCAYVLSTDDIIYPIVTWRDFGSYMYIIGIFIGVVGVYIPSVYISHKKYRARQSNEVHVQYALNSDLDTIETLSA